MIHINHAKTTWAWTKLPMVLSSLLFLTIFNFNNLSGQGCSPDVTPPVFNCTSNITVHTDAGVCSAVVSYATPTATDNCASGPAHPTSLPGYQYMGLFNGHSYFLSQDSVRAEWANDSANAVGAHVVTISDSSENALVSGFTTKEVWIGLTDKAVEGTFVWENGEAVTYTNWAPAEPNDFKAREDYTTTNYQVNPLWNDRFGNDFFHFVIEFDPTNTVPATLTSGPASGATFPLGTTTITYDATDASNNTSQCSFTVTVIDTAAPTVICQDITVQLDAAGNATITPAQIDGGSFANCSGVTLSASQTNFNYSDVGANAVTLTATDANNRSSSCQALVTIPDTVALALTCPGNISVNTDPGNCGAVVSFSATATGNSPVLSYSQAPGTSFSPGTTTVTVTATDANNAVLTCNFDVTVIDVAPPSITCPAPITVAADAGQCSAVVTYADPTATDNCDPTIPPTTLNGFTNAGTFNGHTYFLSNSTATATAAHAMAQANGGHLVTIADAAENAFVKGITTQRVWMGFTDKDSEGNFVWVTGEPVTYTNWDVANGEPNDFNNREDWTVMNFNSASGLWNDYWENNQVQYIIEYDGGTFPVNHVSGPLSGSVFPLGTTTVTYSATDPSGNTAQCSFDITVTDTTKPTATCQNITVNLDASGAASITAQDIDNGSTDDCGTVSLAASQTSFDANDVGANQVFLTVTDNSGNTSTCQAVVTVVGNSVPPSGFCPSDTIVNTDPGTCGAVVNYTMDSGSGSGQPVQTIATRPGNHVNLKDCPKNSWYDVTTISFSPSNVPGTATGSDVTVEDIYLEIDHKRVSDLVVDLESPTGTVVRLIERPGITGLWGSNGCDKDDIDAHFIPGTGNSAENDCSGNKPVIGGTYTAHDGYNLSSLNDGSNPNGTWILRIYDLENKKKGKLRSWAITFNTTSSNITQTAGLPSGSVFPVGTTQNTFEKPDSLGNLQSCSFNVTVVDNEAPQINCPSDITNCASTISWDAPTASDACGIASVSQTGGPATGSTLAMGSHTISYEAMDNHGNSSSCSFTVTRANLSVAIAGNPKVYLGYGPACTLLYADVNGGNPPYNYSWSAGGNNGYLWACTTVPTTYTLTVTDSKGCSGSAQVLVDVEDISCGNNEVKICYQGNTYCVNSWAAFLYTTLTDATLGPCNNLAKKGTGSGMMSEQDFLEASQLNEQDIYAASLSLEAYPNPFAESTTIAWQAPVDQPVKVMVYDMTGRQVALLYEGLTQPGGQETSLSSASLKPGMYMVRITMNGEQKSLPVVYQR